MSIILSQTLMTNITCGACGCAFLVPTALYDARRGTDRPVVCPSGHKNYFTKPQTEVRPVHVDPAAIEQRRREAREVHESDQREAQQAALARDIARRARAERKAAQVSVERAAELDAVQAGKT